MDEREDEHEEPFRGWCPWCRQEAGMEFDDLCRLVCEECGERR